MAQCEGCEYDALVPFLSREMAQRIKDLNVNEVLVKAIAEERGIAMPSFFGYMGWSVVFLVPIFVLVTFLFFL